MPVAKASAPALALLAAGAGGFASAKSVPPPYEQLRDGLRLG